MKLSKFRAGLLIALMSGLFPATVAFADNVHAVYAVVNTDTIEVGQTTIVNYRIGATGSDGCDASDGTPVTVNVNIPTGVTADDSSLNFNLCSSGNVTNAQSVTFTGTVAGDYTFGVSVSGDPTDSYNTNSANITLHVTAAPVVPVVPADVTAPPVPTPLTPANNTYTTTAGQLLITWSSVVDAVSNPVTYMYQSSNSSDTDVNGAFVTPAYTSGPLSTSEIPTGGTPEGVYYWHVKAIDSLGNASAWSEAWKITVDNTAPTVVCDPAVADGAWHQNDASFPCTSVDNGPAGLANIADASFSLSTNVAAGTEDADASTVSHADVCDLSGNCTAVAAITGNMIDKKGPTISLTNPTAVEYTLHQVVNAAYSCADAASGVASCTGTVANGSSIYTGAIGAQTFSVNSTDNVGNAASTASVSYTVGTYKNFALGTPLAMSAKDYKNASTIPVKFTIKNIDGTSVSQAIAHLTVNGISAKSSGSANSGDLFRYDASAKQYIYNLSVKSVTNAHPNTMVITLDDGTTRSIQFTIK